MKEEKEKVEAEMDEKKQQQRGGKEGGRRRKRRGGLGPKSQAPATNRESSSYNR